MNITRNLRPQGYSDRVSQQNPAKRQQMNMSSIVSGQSLRGGEKWSDLFLDISSCSSRGYMFVYVCSLTVVSSPSASHPPTIRHLSAIYPPTIRHLSAIYPPSIRQPSAIYPPRSRLSSDDASNLLLAFLVFA